MCMRCGTGSVAYCTGDHAAYEAELAEQATRDFWVAVAVIAYGLMVADSIRRTNAGT